MLVQQLSSCIDQYSGVITRNFSVYLDHERVSQYTLDVSATDRGEPSNTATVEVIINVLVSPIYFVTVIYHIVGSKLKHLTYDLIVLPNATCRLNPYTSGNNIINIPTIIIHMYTI